MYEYQDQEQAVQIFEDLLSQKKQELTEKIDSLSLLEQCASVLTSSMRKGSVDVDLLLQHQDLLLSIDPNLADNFKILDFFAQNNALDLEQAQVAISQILSAPILKKSVSNQARNSTSLRKVERELRTIDTMNETAKAQFVANSTLSDKDKIVVLSSMAYQNVLSAGERRKSVERFVIADNQDLQSDLSNGQVEEVDVTHALDDAASLESFQDTYRQMKETSAPFFEQYYSLIEGKTSEDINYHEQLCKIMEDAKANGDNSISMDDFSYSDEKMTLLLLQMKDVEKQINELMQASIDNESISFLYMFLEEYNHKLAEVSDLDQQIQETNSVENAMETPSNVYFLLDDKGKPFFSMSRLNHEDKKQMLALVHKFEQGILDFKNGKKHSKVLSNEQKMPHTVYVNKVSNMICAFIPQQDDILIITFGNENNIFDDSRRIDIARESLIDDALKCIKEQDPAFVQQQVAFRDTFQQQLSSAKEGVRK